MRAASRESYAAAAERLAGFAADASPAALATAADELLTVTSMLAAEPRLRRALSDPARPGSDRAGLAHQLFDGKASAPTIDVLATLVSGRWSSAAELLTATELLVVDALIAGADRAGELAEVEDELFRFGQVAAGTPALGTTLADTSVPAARRTELVHSLLDGKAKIPTIRLIELAVRGLGGRNFAAGLQRLVEMVAEHRNRSVAYITVAAPLGAAEQDRLGAKLASIYGREVSLRFDVDPGVIGGISVRVGSDLYDGTIARRLAEARQALTTR